MIHFEMPRTLFEAETRARKERAQVVRAMFRALSECRWFGAAPLARAC